MSALDIKEIPMMTRTQLDNLLKRLLLTFTFVFLSGVLVASNTSLDFSLVGAAALAGAAAVLSALKTIVSTMVDATPSEGLANLAWRALWTFLQGSLAVLAVSGADLTTLVLWQAALVGGVAALASAVKTVAGDILVASAPSD